MQCRGSDKREITLPTGRKLVTANLRIGDFDLLVVSLFRFGNRWRFAFARNNELPCSTHKAYTEEDRKCLLPNFIPIADPLEAPFRGSPIPLLDAIVADRMGSVAAPRLHED